MSNTAEPILTIENLCVSFEGSSRREPAVAVDGISLKLFPGEMLAIVGESGCGKSVTAMSILRLLPTPPAIVSGSVLFKKNNILEMSDVEVRKIRGKEISIIFQQPMTSLNPVLTIERQLTEVVMLHEKISRKKAIEKAYESLNLVGITDIKDRLYQYPHQLSGGMRQRVMIAMAISCNPRVLIADEPTTALDVTTQAQILILIKEIQTKLGVATILITHDLGIVAETADRVAVMYFGKIVEQADTRTLFKEPSHPYTKGLMKAVPRLDLLIQGDKGAETLNEIKGMVPSINDKVVGCPFASRCISVKDICHKKMPPEVKLDKQHTVSCWEFIK